MDNNENALKPTLSKFTIEFGDVSFDGSIMGTCGHALRPWLHIILSRFRKECMIAFIADAACMYIITLHNCLPVCVFNWLMKWGRSSNVVTHLRHLQICSQIQMQSPRHMLLTK